MSFNKTSFLCLIVLMLMTSFIASTALGHSDAQRTANNTASPAVRVVGYIPDHNHPVRVAELATDRNGDGDNQDKDEGPVPAHSGHVTVTSIEAVASGSGNTASKVKTKGGVNYVTLGTITDESDTNTTKGTEASSIEVRIKFDGSIVEAASTQHAARTALAETFMTSSALTALSLDKDGKAFSTQGISIGDDYDWWIGTDGKEVAFIITATAGGTAVPTASAKTILRLQVNAGSVFSPQKPVVDGVNSTDVNGFGIEESKVYEFHLVTALPDDDPPVDKTPPILTITSAPPAYTDLPKTGAKAGKVEFTFSFDDPLGTKGDAPFTQDDIQVTNALTIATLSGSGKVYKLLVTPRVPTLPVKVTVPKGAVLNTENLALAKDTEYMWAPPDETPPTVVITGDVVKAGTDKGKVDFIFTFSEPIKKDTKPNTGGFTLDDIDRTTSNVKFLNQPELDETVRTDGKEVWTLRVEPKPGETYAQVTLKTLSVSDVRGNFLVGDVTKMVRITEDEAPKVITITSVPAILKQVTPTSPAKNKITITVTDTGGSGIKDGLSQNEVLVPNADISNFKYANGVATFDLEPHLCIPYLTITVIAGAVVDNAGNVSKKEDETFDVGPKITVPANGFLVVTKTGVDPRETISDYAHQAYKWNYRDTIPTAAWNDLPDLERVFNIDRSGDGSIGGEGGGAIVLKPARGETQKKGVYVTEIMWASDLSYRGAPNDFEAQNQWVELQNTTGKAITVFMCVRIGEEAIPRASYPNGAIDYSELSIEMDRAGNFYDGNIGKTHWVVPGQNGNSFDAVDFISMHRHKPDSNIHPNGMAKGSWSASTLTFYTLITRDKADPELYDYIGTPGRPNRATTDTPITTYPATNVNYGEVVISEVANRSNADQTYEWIELYNRTSTDQPLQSWRLSLVTAVGTETELLTLPNNGDVKIKANSTLLIVDTDQRDFPDHHPLLVGKNILKSEQDQALGVRGNNTHSPRYIVVDFKGNGIPDNGEFVMILRKSHKPGSPSALGADAKGGKDLGLIRDIAGYHPNLSKSKWPNEVSNTSLWPLHGFGAPNFGNNKLEVGKVHYRRHFTSNKDGRGGVGAWDNNGGKTAFTDAGFTGIGYRRWVTRTAIHGGDPGYFGNRVTVASAAKVSISEIMLSSIIDNPGSTRDVDVPQWLEISNDSGTQTINLAADNGWELVIETPTDKLRRINFKAKGDVKFIYPHQSILVVASNARSAGSDFLSAQDLFPENRVFKVWDEFGAGFSRIYDDESPRVSRANTRYEFLHPTKFHIRLNDGKGTMVDEIGNLDGEIRTDLQEDPPSWEIPSGNTEDGTRTSLIRNYNNGRTSGPAKGTELKGWILASKTASIFTVRHTWYGAETDASTPGVRGSRPLPVELSAFRPTLEDGKVVIHWTTESELDNAGFNIYRSETRTGEYKQVNAQLIEGAGTTGERTAYKWVDTSAKPGVVYYYQIEDVSFAGERQALAINRLKGYITAKDKLTTRWGELKKTLQ